MSNSGGGKNFSEEEETFTPAPYTPYEDPEHEREAEAYLAALPERDYDGAVFFITAPSTDYLDPEEGGTAAERIAMERNRAVADRYNVMLVTSVSDEGTMLAALRSAVASDTYYTDLLMFPVYWTGQFRMEGVLMNLRSLPFLDLSQPYFNAESVAMTSGGYDTYGVAGDASIRPESFSAALFNRDAVLALDLPLPYGDVVKGTWTWERFFTYVEAARQGIDGDDAEDGMRSDVLSRLNRAVSSSTNSERLADLVFISCGNTYVSAAEKQMPQVSFDVSGAAGAVETAHRLLTGAGIGTFESDAASLSAFGNGETLWAIESLAVLPQLTDSAANWGVVPLPTEKEGGTYRTLVSNNDLIFAVPVNHTNGEMPALVLSALNAASYGLFYDAYLENAMFHVVRDNDSVNMLELIFHSAAFDFALAFGNAYPTVAQGTYGLIRAASAAGDLASRYDGAVETANGTLARYFDLSY